MGRYVDTSAIIQVIGNIYNNVSLLDYEEYTFHEDDFPDFIGKVEYLMFRITDELSEEQANNLSKLIIEYTGKENLEDKNEYLPICINYDLESPH